LVRAKNARVKPPTATGTAHALKNLLKLFLGSFLTHTIRHNNIQILQRHKLVGQFGIFCCDFRFSIGRRCAFGERLIKVQVAS
jgi:hypothetical protein